MMYNSKLVASIKCDGKIMREHGETVYLPFGREYSILLKNLNSQRALVNISIDGQDVVPSGLVLGGNQSIDLERFILNGNLGDGPRFKFIEKTDQISAHRGDRIEDGLVRISYKYEAQYQPYAGGIWTMYKSPTVYGDGSSLRNLSVGSSVDGGCYNISTTQTTYSAQVTHDGVPVSDSGITTHGSKSNQKFSHASIGALEAQEHVIVLQLKGEVGQHRVVAPVTVKRQVKCNTCGRVNKSSASFCSNCGTNLSYQF